MNCTNTMLRGNQTGAYLYRQVFVEVDFLWRLKVKGGIQGFLHSGSFCENGLGVGSTHLFPAEAAVFWLKCQGHNSQAACQITRKGERTCGHARGQQEAWILFCEIQKVEAQQGEVDLKTLRKTNLFTLASSKQEWWGQRMSPKRENPCFSPPYLSLPLLPCSPHLPPRHPLLLYFSLLCSVKQQKCWDGGHCCDGSIWVT